MIWKNKSDKKDFVKFKRIKNWYGGFKKCKLKSENERKN